MHVHALDGLTEHSPPSSTANMEEPSEQLMDEVVDSDIEAEPTATEEFEDDPKRLIARQKQIDFGKNTIGYENYLKAVPKDRRRKFGPLHDPPTPDITKKYSKKAWDGIVKAWRRHLHKFDDMKPHDLAPSTTPSDQPGSTNGEGMASAQAGSGSAVPAGDGSRAARRWSRGKGPRRQQQQTPKMQHTRQQQQGHTSETTPAMQQSRQPEPQADDWLDTGRDGSRQEPRYGGSGGTSGQQRRPVNSRGRHHGHDEGSKATSQHERQQGYERHRFGNRARDSGGREYGASSDRWRDSNGHTSSADRHKWEAPGSCRSSRDDRADRDRSARWQPQSSKQQQQSHGEHEREQDVWQYQGRPAGRSWADEVDQADADAAAGGGCGTLSEDEVDPRHGSSNSPAGQARKSSRHSRGQLTPAKRSSSQGGLDRRPLKTPH